MKRGGLQISRHMATPESWRKEFHRALIAALAETGTPLSPDPHIYGWIHDDYDKIRERVIRTGVDLDKSTWTEASWEEFQGTFYEGDTRVVGIDAKLVLTDGTTVIYRWSGSVSDLILAVVRGEEVT